MVQPRDQYGRSSASGGIVAALAATATDIGTRSAGRHDASPDGVGTDEAGSHGVKQSAIRTYACTGHAEEKSTDAYSDKRLNTRSVSSGSEINVHIHSSHQRAGVGEID